MYKNREDDSDIIQAYVFSDDADYIIEGLEHGIKGLELCEDCLDDLDDFVVLITIIPEEGGIMIENAHFEDDGVIKEPSEYINYMDAELPYYIISEVSGYETPTLVYHVSDEMQCGGGDGEFDYYFDGDDYHGFHFKADLPCGTKYKMYFTSDPLTKEQVDELLELL